MEGCGEVKTTRQELWLGFYRGRKGERAAAEVEGDDH
jgi:hypothetical protein